MRRSAALFAMYATIVGCKKSSPAVDITGPSLPSAPDHVGLDDLWEFEPPGATIAVVTSGALVGKVAEFASPQHVIRQVIAASPAGAKFESAMATFAEKVGVPLPFSAADLGLAAKEFAFFEAEEGNQVFVFPVGDRAKFVAAFKGKAADQSSPYDRFGTLLCTERKNRYVCARDQAVFNSLGSGTLRAHRKTLDWRGDVELIFDADKRGEAPMRGIVIAAARVSAGQLAIRAMLPREHEPVAFSKKPSVKLAGASGFVIAETAPLLQQIAKERPNASKVLDVGLLGNLSVVFPAGRFDVDGRIGVKSGSKLAALVGRCEAIGQPPGLRIAGNGNSCEITAPDFGASLTAWMDGDELRFAHTKGEYQPGISLPTSALATELADGSWHAAAWGRGAILANLGRTLPVLLKQQDILARIPTDILAQSLAALSSLSEFGFGFDSGEKHTRVLFGVRTTLAESDKLFLAIHQAALDAAKSPQGDTSALAQLAEQNPSSSFVSDWRAGSAGLLPMITVTGAIAAVAVPSFVQYMNRSKLSEAESALGKIRKQNLAAFTANDAFVVGEVEFSPAEDCCTQNAEGESKCAVDTNAFANPVWKQLDFAMTKPHYFRYSYRGTATEMVATAEGDLDCDGTTVQYTLTGRVENGTARFKISEPTTRD